MDYYSIKHWWWCPSSPCSLPCCWSSSPTPTRRCWCGWWTTLQPARGHVFCQETGMENLEVVWILRFIIVVDQSNWSTMINCFCLLCLFVRCANHFSICHFLSTYIYNSQQQWNIYEARGSLLLSYMHNVSSIQVQEATFFFLKNTTNTFYIHIWKWYW